MNNNPPGPCAPPGVPHTPARMIDVARLAGVSQQTVSRVVNGHSNVAPEARKRVDHHRRPYIRKNQDYKASNRRACMLEYRGSDELPSLT